MDFLFRLSSCHLFLLTALKPKTQTEGATPRGGLGGGGCYLFGLQAGATAGLWSENRSAGSDTVAPKPNKKEETL